MKKLVTAFIISVQAIILNAQITIPNENFLPGQIIASAPANSNFGTLGDKALNRAGGVITGHITADSGVTIDGADVGAFLDGSGRVRAQTGTLALSSSGETNTGFTFGAGSISFRSIGIERGLLNSSGFTIQGKAVINSSGKIPVISATYFTSVSGASVLPAESSIADGTLLARLSANESISGQWQFNPGTITASKPITFRATWNNSGVTFTGLLVSITNTLSAVGSAPARVRLEGIDKFSVGRTGTLAVSTIQLTGGPSADYFLVGDGNGLGSWTPSATNSPVPSGMFAWFEAACPVGWTIKSDAANTYNNRMVRGGPTFSGAGGGSDTHTHAADPLATASTSNSVDHTHAVDPAGALTGGSSIGNADHDLSGNLASAGGSHTHITAAFNNTDFTGTGNLVEVGAAITHSHTGTSDLTDISHTHGLGLITDTSRDGDHTHTEDYASVVSGGASGTHTHSTDVASFNTDSVSDVPAYVQVVVCRKD